MSIDFTSLFAPVFFGVDLRGVCFSSPVAFLVADAIRSLLRLSISLTAGAFRFVLQLMPFFQ